MINIGIDGNYIFHKTFGVFGGYGKDPAETFKSLNDQALFIQKVSMDLCASLRKLPTGGRLIFTCDSRSWRKDVDIEGGGYKDKERDGDWSIFYSLLRSFGEHLEKMGFIFSMVEGAEGDDLLYFWSDYFNTKGENCVIVSGDHDLHQLARWKNDNWTVVWSNNTKNDVLAVPIGWDENWLESDDEVSVFNTTALFSDNRDLFSEILRKSEYREINSSDFIFSKMISGDKGDTVPGIWEMEKNNKIYRMTPKKTEEVLTAFKESIYKDLSIFDLIKNEEFLFWVSGISLRIIGDIDSTENRKKAISNLLRNYKLMWLDKYVIPPKVIKNVLNELKRAIKLERRTVTLDRIKILEGTTWVPSDVAPSTYSPFENY
jgi:5'-3' exonuclease